MTTGRIDEPTTQKPLRLWPGVLAVVLQWLAWMAAPLVLLGPLGGYVMALGSLLGGVTVVVWWAFLSRAPRSERWGATILMILGLVGTSFFLHESVRTGMMGLMFALYALPVLSLAFVAWAVASRRLPTRLRRATMVATILLACGGWTLLRTGGITGGGTADLAWRWAETPEERLLARVGEEPLEPSAASSAAEASDLPIETRVGDEADSPVPAPAAVEAPETVETAPEWPGFRGRARDSVIRGVRIETDWSASPPVELWRRSIGPGWSSFAVRGELVYTQEQRGDDEVVACYKATTGEPVWKHRDAARFWESNAGAGPRATPTLSSGRVFTFGATGIVNALDADDGAVVWSRDAASDSDTETPAWGFSSSPLVVDDLVIVAAAGALVAYDIDTGEPRWIGPATGDGYSSPHQMTIDGVAQVVLLSSSGATSVALADGTLIWEHSWPSNTRIVQPARTGDGDILLSAGEGAGMRRIAVAHGPEGWVVEERWTSVRLKPYFNDFVVHEGHAFGFDGRMLVCIDTEDGERKWKGGRYGHGQLVLLPDQDLLLVLSEEGELVLVGASPDKFAELGRLPALDGKTWNHPVLVGDVLLVRNGQEMAAFRLSLAS